MSASKHDWGLIFAGVALAAAGFFCMLAPGLTIVTIAAVVGAFFLVAGVFDIISYIRLRNILPRSGWELAYAIIDVLLGLIFLLHPLAFSAVVPWLVGVCFVAFGVFEVIASVKAHGWGVPMWGWALFSGVLNVLCGIAFFVMPQMLSVFGHHPAGARRNPDGVRLERGTLYHDVALRVCRIWAYRSITVWQACRLVSR